MLEEQTFNMYNLVVQLELFTKGIHSMQSINFTSARDKLASVLDAVTNGEPVMITRRSAKPVIVVDAEQYAKLQLLQAEADFDWLFAEHGETLKALKNR